MRRLNMPERKRFRCPGNEIEFDIRAHGNGATGAGLHAGDRRGKDRENNGNAAQGRKLLKSIVVARGG
jgi:hypothetical protein